MRDLDKNGLYAMYLRRSRADQEAERLGAGETLSRHHTMLQDLAQKLLGHSIPESCIYREIVSGDTVQDRPQMRALLSAVSDGEYDGVFCAEIDRLARGDTMDQGLVAQTFMYSSTLIITPNKVYDPESDSDSEFFEMKLFFARREYQSIKRRMQAGRVNAFKEGCYLGSTPVYGYDRAKIEGGRGWTLTINPDQAAVVRSAYDLYLNGLDGEEYGCDRISRRFNDLGITTGTGKKWTASNIYRMLSHEIYCGRMHWYKRPQRTKMIDGQKVTTRPDNRENMLTVLGRHEPLISEEVFDRVRARMRGNQLSPAAYGKSRKNPLAGLIKCGNCGHGMSAQRLRSGEYVLTCSRASAGCRIRGCSLPRIEAAVLDSLEALICIKEEQISDNVTFLTPNNADLIAGERHKLETLEKQLSSLYDLLEQGIYTPDLFLQRQRDINSRIDIIKSAIDTLSVKPSKSRGEQLRELAPQIRTVIDIYSEAPDADAKNRLLKSVLKRIVYHNNLKPEVPDRCHPLTPNNPTIELFPLIDD